MVNRINLNTWEKYNKLLDFNFTNTENGPADIYVSYQERVMDECYTRIVVLRYKLFRYDSLTFKIELTFKYM